MGIGRSPCRRPQTSTEAVRQSKLTAMDRRGATARHAYEKLKSPTLLHARQRTGKPGPTPRERQFIEHANLPHLKVFHLTCHGS